LFRHTGFAFSPDPTRKGDTSACLHECADREIVRLEREAIKEKVRDSPAQKKTFARGMIFTVLMLQPLHNRSDDAMEYQIRDRLPSGRFPGAG
jgi:hypothetical protein